jgi:MOSC domain-containing protein YiiM
VASLESVNVGGLRTVEWHGRSVTTGIWKAPVAGRVALRGVNLDGDAQADLRVHGGPDKAVYAYAAEDYAWWSERLQLEITPGTFGENLTTAGIELGAAVIGTSWRVGTARLEVAQPRLPCFKLGMRMGDAAFVDTFEAAARFGAYLRIAEEGDVGAGDHIEIGEAPADGITVGEVGRAQRSGDDALYRRLLDDPHVPVTWKEWASRRLGRSE